MQEPHKLHTTNIFMHVFEEIESFYDDVMITPSEILADILHGSVGVTVANVNAASGRSAQPSLAISWKTLSQLSCFLIHLVVSWTVLYGSEADALVSANCLAAPSI
jgi:hypothetical protein